MSDFSVIAASRTQKWVAGTLVVAYAVITLLPLLWIIATGFKSPSDAIAVDAAVAHPTPPHT